MMRMAEIPIISGSQPFLFPYSYAICPIVDKYDAILYLSYCSGTSKVMSD